MAFKAPLRAGKNFRITYAADLKSDGTTLIRVLWIPKQGGPVPEPQHAEVTPGDTGVIEDVIPSDSSCRWMELWADLPDGGGNGVLTLLVDGQAHSSATLSADALWTAMVIP